MTVCASMSTPFGSCPGHDGAPPTILPWEQFGPRSSMDRTILQKIALKGRHKSPCTEAVGPLKIGADYNGSCARRAVTGCKHPVPVFGYERSERAAARGGLPPASARLARACTARRRSLRLTRCVQRVPGFGAEAPLHFVAQNLFCVTKCVSCYPHHCVESRIMWWDRFG